MSRRSFRIDDREFLLDGEPFRILSGALHYFRVHPDDWTDRIRKARLMGLNTIETYVAWNAHSPVPGTFEVEGGLDLGRFLDLVHAEDMLAIVRPGPYICAEWHNGGLPAWLLRHPDVRVRSREPRYMAAVTEYLRNVFDIVVPRQVDHGGPVALMQVENEYGAYGNDAGYLERLTEIYREQGVVVPLTTVDQPRPHMLAGGSLPGLLTTGSFGSRASERLRTLREHQPTGPLMCSEFWCGWFDHWGEYHHVTSAEDSATELDHLLSAGASVNVYMFHGGTNFGLTNGANDKGVYQPIVTSYDYDAPLDEAGRPTEKYWSFREVISRHVPVPDEVLARDHTPFHVPEPAPLRRRTLPQVTDWTAHDTLPSMDDLHLSYGFLQYRTRLDGASGPAVLEFAEVRDRAWVCQDGRQVGVIARSAGDRSLLLPSGRGELTLLVEDEGRVNYGKRLGEPKGLIGPALLDGRPIETWETAPVDLDALPALAPSLPEANSPTGAGVLTAHFTLEAPTDLAIATEELGWGVAWINGFALGRFRPRGPQRTLFVPAPATRAGENVVMLYTQEPPRTDRLSFAADLSLGPIDT